MGWDKSDSDLKEKFNFIDIEINLLNIKLRKWRSFQEKINDLKMRETLVVDEHGLTSATYSLPDSYSGNEMKESHRETQKNELIINIDNFKGE